MVEKKKRKTASGPIRDKSRTMTKMINAVGKVLQKKGYENLNAATIARAAGVDKKLVWTYFGSVDNLIEEYINLKAFWTLGVPNSVITKIIENPDKVGEIETAELLDEYFNTFNQDIALQKVVHWEMGQSTKLLRKVADKREIVGEQLFSLVDNKFKDSEVDIRATIALLLGGIYYLNLHANTNGSTVCGIDLNKDKDKERIKKAMEKIIKNAFDDIKD